MIKKLKIGLLIAVLSLVVEVSSAHAADLVWSVNTTVSIDSNNYIIQAGSEATSIAVGATTLTVTVPSGSYFNLTSASKYLLNNSIGQSLQCDSSVSALRINGEQTSVIITPDATHTCSSGGSGGGGSYTPPTDTTPPTNTSVSINVGATSTSSLSATLTLAATDATQMLVSNDAGFAGATWETYATSKLWTLTSGDGVKTVYAKFRDAALNMSASTSDSIIVSGTGTVAVPVTPAEGCSGGNLVNPLTGQSCLNNSDVSGGCSGGNLVNSLTGQSCNNNVKKVYDFGTKTLKNGSKGEAVKELQRFLNQVLNLGLVIDGKLGPKTIAVIKKWQKAHGLKADGLIGPKTKALMNSSVQ